MITYNIFYIRYISIKFFKSLFKLIMNKKGTRSNFRHRMWSLRDKVARIWQTRQVTRWRIVEHINTFLGYVNQVVAAKFPFDDAMQAILLMCTLSDSWKNLVVTLSTSCQEENLSIQVVKTSILNEEARRKDKGGVKCGSTYRQRKKPTKKPTEERKVSCQIQVQR